MAPKPDPFLQDYYEPSPPRKGLGFHAASVAIFILMPWLIFTTVCCLMTFAYHHFRVLVWAMVFLGALLSLLFIALSSRSRRGPFFYIALGVLCIFAILLSTALGLYCYYEYAIKFWSCEEGRAYVNVRPEESAAGHLDAGRLTFSEEAHVDTSRSVGYRGKDGGVYCVAPVLGETDLVTAEYFAAGEDCCGQRGNFNCDGAWDSKAKSGVVIIEGNKMLSNAHEMYVKAAQEAAGAYDLKLGKKPMFVRWVRDTQAIEDGYWNDCMMFLVCVCFGHLFFSTMVGLVIHFSTGVRPRKA
jgi:hypothetical protein